MACQSAIQAGLDKFSLLDKGELTRYLSRH